VNTRSLVAVTSTLVTVTLGVAIPASATASTQYGNGCTATTTVSNVTLAMTAKSSLNPLPIAAPSSGILTNVTFSLPSIGPSTLPTKVKIMRPTGAPNALQVVAESASLSIADSAHSFPIRVPVQTGDLLGLSSPLASIICGTANAGDVTGQVAGEAAVGTTATYPPTPSRALPMVVTLEADIDNDGFGDETQDGCPQSATFQGPCPVITLDSASIGEKSAVRVLVTSSIAADVTATAKAKLPKSGGGSKRKPKTIKLGPVTKAVNPPKIGDFTLRFPKALKQALASGKSVKLTVTASATDVIGRVSTSSDKLKLKG
jgi:hypothetical protein